MQTHKDECMSKSVTINKLQKRIGELETILHFKNTEIKNCVNEKNIAIEALAPTKESLNRMTAENGKLLRKIKRSKS